MVNRGFVAEDSNILHGPEPTGIQHVAWSKLIDLKFIKKVHKAADATFNDVLMTCVTGSIRKYFKVHASTIPEVITCVVPVSLRNLEAR